LTLTQSVEQQFMCYIKSTNQIRRTPLNKNLLSNTGNASIQKFGFQSLYKPDQALRRDAFTPTQNQRHTDTIPRGRSHLIGQPMVHA